MADFADLRGEQARQIVDAEQVFEGYRAARVDLDRRFAGAMSWKRVRGREYLYRKHGGAWQALGPRGPEVLLDTNVVSELRKTKGGRADRNVAWADSVSPAMLFLSVITVLELEQGTLRLDRRDGAQATLLRRWLQGSVLPAFADRILPIDTAVARRCAQLHVPNPHAERDAFIAATVLVHGLAVVTRNGSDIVGNGVRVVDPWRSSPG